MFRNPDDDDAESCGNGCGCGFFCKRTGPVYDETPPAPPQRATKIRNEYRTKDIHESIKELIENLIRNGLIDGVIDDLDD